MATHRDRPDDLTLRDQSEYYFPSVDNPLSDHEVHRAAGALRADQGTPEQARALLSQFVLEAYTTAGPSRELTVFVRDALAEHLASGKSLEAAFRLKKGRRGRPNAETRKRRKMAEEMLLLRVVAGLAFEDAAHQTAEIYHVSRSVVCDAFRLYKSNALAALQDAERPAIDFNDPTQQARLSAIFD